MSPWRRRLRVLVPCVVVAAVAAAPSAQQPPPIGIAPVTLAAGPYVFDTAEQHKIAVSVVAALTECVALVSPSDQMEKMSFW